MSENPEYLDLLELAEAATPLPWVPGAFVQHRRYDRLPESMIEDFKAKERLLIRSQGPEGAKVSMLFPGPMTDPDRAYIIAACNAVPTLVQEIERQRKVIDFLKTR